MTLLLTLLTLLLTLLPTLRGTKCTSFWYNYPHRAVLTFFRPIVRFLRHPFALLQVNARKRSLSPVPPSRHVPLSRRTSRLTTHPATQRARWHPGHPARLLPPLSTLPTPRTSTRRVDAPYAPAP